MNSSNRYLKYKGYEGSIEYSLDDGILFGKVQGIKSLISYEGVTIQELEKDFKGAIDDYLNSCKQNGNRPEKPFKGKFNVRISPKLHQELANYAANKHQSLNASVEEAIKKLLA
ncbi:HicB protein [Lactobacillus hamsteri DSM 5661 = JCM 6256]|uniref:HicB protein n=2 Tax=Lactobacillus hamsteri TaxID=96565 RepID=A0A0R1YFW7_9LACO|nr:HicB protein [Lactobacillus hamsteri DSM 5661 = JCM 6256]